MKLWVAGILLVSLSSGCLVVPLPGEEEKDPGLPDGTECAQDSECRSGTCGYDRLCSHSLCDCPGDSCDPMGEASSDCAKGWTCAYYESIIGDVGEFFGVDHDLDAGYCQPLCADGCPEHYTCADGHFCRADSGWAAPVATVSWSGDAEGSASGRSGTTESMLEQGKTVALSASATSPIDLPIKEYSWTIVNGSGIGSPMAGAEVTLSQGDGSFLRADLLVLDEESRSASLSIVFNSCLGTGHQCGYQGSGCCRSCDVVSNLCL